MSTAREARAKLRDIAAKAADAVNRTDLTTAQKKSLLDKYEPELKYWTEEHEAWEYIASKRKTFADAGDIRPPGTWAKALRGSNFGGDMTGTHTTTDLATKGLRTAAAPPARLDGDQARELFEAARSRKSFAVDIDLKTTDSAAVGPAGIPDFDRAAVLARREPNRVLDLIPSRFSSSPIIEYFVQATRATAGVVAEGAIKPGSEVSLPMQSAHAAKIAAWVDVTDETLTDFDQFHSVVTNDLTAAVVDAENVEMLLGTGIGPRFITGLLNTTGILTRTRDTAAELYQLDTLDLALNDLRSGPAFAELTSWVMNPATFSSIRRTKTSQGVYVLGGDPSAETAQQIWGKPVLLTTQMPANTVLGGDFADACRGFVRDGMRVTMSNSTTDAAGVSNFKRNITTVLAEERLGAYVVRPTSLIKVTL